MSTRTPTDIDKHVGARLRLRRAHLKLSQSDLGNKLGVTFQQIQKYERGTNRVGASRLFHVGRVLKVPVAYFFEGLDDQGVTALDEETADKVYEFIASPDGLTLASAFAEVKDQKVRRSLIELVRSLRSDA